MGKVLKCDFQKIIDNPFVFYQREYAEDGSYYYWLARGGVVSGTMKESAFDSKRYVYTLEEGLGICDISTSYENGKYLEVVVTPFSFSSYNHIKKLFAHFLAQISHSAYTKYGTSNCKEILFCLNNLDWNEFLLIKVLKEFSNDDIIKILDNLLMFSFCLSPLKQDKITYICRYFYKDYKPYKPSFIRVAYECVFPKSVNPIFCYDTCGMGLFEIISAVMGDNWFWSNYDQLFIEVGMQAPVFYNIKNFDGIDSPLVKLAREINNKEYIPNFKEFEWLFWFLPSNVQFIIINRCLQKIKNGDIENIFSLFKCMVSNKAVPICQYRQFIENPFVDSEECKVVDIIKEITTLLSRYFNATNTNKQESISQLLLQISEIVDFSKFDN